MQDFNSITKKIFTVHCPRKIIFGFDALRKVGGEARKLGRKLLIVTDPVIEEKSGLIPRIRKSLEGEGLRVEVFNGVEPEPKLKIAETVASFARKVEPDFIVGVGGGSVLDMAKIASIAINNPKRIQEYLGTDMVDKPALPKILIPTTAGTGSEATNVAVVSLTVEEIKSVVVSPYLLADVAIVDPEASSTMPHRLTANTGVDALTHAIEALISVNSNPLTDLEAFEAVRLVFKNLRDAYREGGNMEARHGMALAALLAGLAFGSAGVCGGHAVAYAFSVKYNIPHGMACGIALPYIMEYNMSDLESKLARVAQLSSEDVGKLEVHDAAVKAVLATRAFLKDLDFPSSLKELGIEREALPRLAEDLLKMKRLLDRQPRKITILDAHRIIDRAWSGILELDEK